MFVTTASPFALEGPPDGFEWTRSRWGRGLRSIALQRVADHVFTTRDLRLSSADGEWAQVADTIGARTLVRLRQVHGAAVVTLRRDSPRPRPGERPEGDILVSDDPAIAIAVQAADCVPLLMADPKSGAVAAAHAGWRGMAARVPLHAVRALADTFSADPASLIVAIGPSIGPCCYEVGRELVDAFASAGFDRFTLDEWFMKAPRGDRLILDMWTTAIDQLVEAGVRRENIASAELCTATRGDLFPSYRRERDAAGRIAGAIRPRDRRG